MAAGYQDQFIEQATTFTTVLTLTDNNGSPYDLTGFSVKSEAKKSYYSANATLKFTATVTDAANGKIQLFANNAITANVPAGKLVYDVIIKENASNNVTRVLEGQIIVSPAVSKY